MNDFDDPLDLLDDDGDGVVEMCLLEEEEKQIEKKGNNKTGCSFVLFWIGSTITMFGWLVYHTI